MTTFRSWNGRVVEPIVAPARNLYWSRICRGYAPISEREDEVLEEIDTRNEIAHEVWP